MLFNSYEFLVFFPAVVILYFGLPHRYRWILLLLASYVFYMAWNPYYIVLIVISTLIDYGAGIALQHAPSPWLRRSCLFASIATNLGILFLFKYFNFFASAAEALATTLGRPFLAPHIEVLLPVGISFYTFQTMSYTIDVYRGTQTAERHLGYFALFVAYFPQLVAGPIERSQRLLPQLRESHHFEYARVRAGVLLMAWGMFKKVVIADHLAVLADAVYADPHVCDGPILALGTLAFAFQIYCDFSGYSDIAIGAARVMGVDLMRNFNRPYRAVSFADFWARWHISLSTWFRDYVYISLGGNRVRAARWVLNIAVVFLVSGLWHGANWTFVVWGGLHAIYYLVEAGTARALPPWLRQQGLLLRVRPVLVFAGVCIAWIFFRAASMADAVWILTHLGSGWEKALFGAEALDMIRRLDYPAGYVAVHAMGIAALLIVEGRDSRTDMIERLPTRVWWVRWTTYILLGWCILNLGSTREQPFIYFQF